MLAFTLRRIAVSIPILLLSSFIVFLLVATSGDPLEPLKVRQPPVPQQTLDAEAARLWLNDPLLARYFRWLGGLFQGDFGPSVISTQDIGAQIGTRFFVTLRLIALAMVIALVLAVIVGVVSAVKQYSITDYTATFVGFLFLSMPAFWLAILLKQAGIEFNLAIGDSVIYTIGEATPNFQGSTWERIADIAGHMVLPTISLALISYAAWSRYQRASMLEVMNADYIRLARAKGVPRGTVMVRHGLRNALIPLTTVTALDLASIISGAVVTERVFQWHGMGEFLLESIVNADVYATMAWLLVTAVVVIVFNLIADLLYAVLDPRIRYA